MDYLSTGRFAKRIFYFVATIAFLGCSSEEEVPDVVPEPEPGQEVPVAVDDEVTTAENTPVRIEGLMENDEVSGYARITDVDATSEAGGSIQDHDNYTYTYTPPSNYTGEDSFEYTICDNAATPNCSTATVNITVTEASPTAVDDAFEAQEDTPLTIRNYLNNDELVDNAEIESVNAEASTGTAVLEANGNITYTPAEGFAGEDSFTYTICDDDEDPSCSTATITITVVDEGTPTANDDQIVVNAGSSEVVIENLLDNDDLIDDAVLTSVDASGAQGEVVLNADGTVTYRPAGGFTGDDTFTYSLCDDDSPDPTCSTGTVTVKVVEEASFNIPSNIQYYYENAVLTEDPELLEQELTELTIEQHVNLLEYYQRHDYLYDADADLNNPEYVVLMYTGDLRPWEEYQQGDLDDSESFNTEHIYPQSLLSSDIAKNDMHHMRVADVDINSLRLNHPFTTGSGEAKLIDGDKWYPGDEWKGDVARMVMYIHIKYGEPFSDVGNLDMFLRWNAEDPVSDFERQRQEVIEGAQGNRNPFIDNPYLATLIWGGTPAENYWE